MSGVLDGVRVIELGQVLAGPFAGAILGDLGADVIKVERTDGGDDARHMGPAFRHGDALNFHVFNRNKRSVALDLKSADGRAALERWRRRPTSWCTTCARASRKASASTARRCARAIPA